jgi:hypothetical protein
MDWSAHAQLPYTLAFCTPQRREVLFTLFDLPRYKAVCGLAIVKMVSSPFRFFGWPSFAAILL